MRRRLITSLVAVLGAAGLTMSLAAPAHADTTLKKRCTFQLKASNGDHTSTSQVVYVDTTFLISNGHAIATSILISNYTGRQVTLTVDRWEDTYRGLADRGPGGTLDNGRALPAWSGTSLFTPAPDGSLNMRVHVAAVATSRTGMGGDCSNYVS